MKLRYMSSTFHGIHPPLANIAQLMKPHSSCKYVDGSWYLPVMQRNGFEEFQKERISNAVFFDIDKFSLPNTNLPHMLPTKEQFEHFMGHELGLTEDDNIIVYDGLNIFSSCRVYWTFKYFGHKNIAVLNGGLPMYKIAGFKIETGPPRKPKPAVYKATVQPKLLRSLDQIQENIKKWKHGVGELVIDVRPHDRYTGETPDIRPGVQSGHMPFTKNIPYIKLINMKTGEMISDDEIRHQLHMHGADWRKDRFVTSCGSGVTACMMYVALEKIGVNYRAVYDGSWAEYGSQGDKVEVYRIKDKTEEE